MQDEKCLASRGGVGAATLSPGPGRSCYVASRWKGVMRGIAAVLENHADRNACIDKADGGETMSVCVCV